MRMTVVSVMACVTVGFALAQETSAAVKRYELDIPRQTLDTALKELAQQTGLQIARFTDNGHGSAMVGPVRGAVTAETALDSLLAPAGLTYRVVNERTIAVMEPDPGTPAPAAGSAEGISGSAPGNGRTARATPRPVMMVHASAATNGRNEAGVDQERPQKKAEEMREEITVVGTRIKGTQATSPVVTISQDDMRLSGHHNLGDVIRALPQNFAGGQNPEVAGDAAAGGGTANQNLTGSSSLNLRGLGPDATLTLFNGARLPYDGFIQATDVSAIPVAAIERVEILLDGASAIYGSDAVGGVVNIILKRDYEGAELSARYGAATDGGYGQRQYTGIWGSSWDSGGFLVTGDFSRNEGVRAEQRDYLGYLHPDITIYPSSEQGSGLLSGYQRIGAALEFAVDAFLTDRDWSRARQQFSAASFFTSTDDSSIWGISPTLKLALGADWTVRLNGAFGTNNAESHIQSYSSATGLPISMSVSGYFNRATSASIEAEGPLFSLPGGVSRLSFGGGYRKNYFETTSAGIVSVSGANRSQFVYGEVNLPLISEEQGIPFIDRLVLSGALRHENYKGFEATTTPKIGAVWTLAPGFDLKGSWGRSFKAPTVLDQYRDTILVLFSSASFAGAPMSNQVIALQGGNSELQPERAETLTFGLVAAPENIPGLRLELSWYDIQYKDRVVFPLNPFFQALSDPAFEEFVTATPTLMQQEEAFASAAQVLNLSGEPYDPASVISIIDNRSTNAASRHVSGVDINARYAVDFIGGRLSVSGNTSWITDATRELTTNAAERPASGIIYFPPEFKGRLNVSWFRNGLTLSSAVNHIGGVQDTNLRPSPKGASMSTVDVIVDYQGISDVVGEYGISFSVANLFDRKPPFLQPIQPFYVNYDSTNYSAVGRVVSATLRKRF